MDQLSIFVNVLMVIAAGVVTIGGAGAVVVRFYSWVHNPHKELEGRVKKHDELLDNDNKRLCELEKSNRLIMSGVIQLMTHEIDGNHVDQLTDTRDKMREYLINK